MDIGIAKDEVGVKEEHGLVGLLTQGEGEPHRHHRLPHSSLGTEYSDPLARLRRWSLDGGWRGCTKLEPPCLHAGVSVPDGLQQLSPIAEGLENVTVGTGRHCSLDE